MTNHHMADAEKWFDAAVDKMDRYNPDDFLKMAQIQAILAVAQAAQEIADELTDRGGITLTTEFGFKRLKDAAEEMGRKLGEEIAMGGVAR